MAENGLTEYYERRAREYEAVYFRSDPVRRAEQNAIAEKIRTLLATRRVLEIACGTGYWTEKIADVAEYVMAIDLSREPLEIAKSKGLPPDRIRFQEADAFDLEAIDGSFNAALANFWFSHLPKKGIQDFLDRLHSRLEPNSVVFMADNVYLPGIGGDLIRKPGIEDTYKLRKLSDNSQFEILKNYYDLKELQAIFQPRSKELKIVFGACFWWVSYSV